MNEQRKHLRIRLKDVVTYEENEMVTDIPLKDEPAWLNNVSESGASMEVNHDLASGAEITIQIPLEDEKGEDKTLWIQAKVRWVKEVANAQKAREIGVEFIDLNATDKQLLQRFIDVHNEQAI